VIDTAYESLVHDYHLLSYDELDSTNEEAQRLAQAGGAHGAVIWARKQTQGRGRRGRAWISNDGNLFVSFLLAPHKSLEQLPELSFVAGLAVLDTLQPIVADLCDIALKWPNDVLLDGRKVAGILAESFETPAVADRDACRWTVIGVGMNVEHHPTSGVAYPAIDLKAAGVEIISAKIILSRLIHHFIQRYDQWMLDGFAPIRAAWKANAYKLGEEMTVRSDEGDVTGLFVDVDAHGRVVLERENHERKVIGAGDVLSRDTSLGSSHHPIS
jgi:BirA family biotin operon repressor/biotin-[acetyl-CoA-carboxylase] ligase